jgi:RNA polymerase sigma-70 factor (ECF subfamily)
MRDSTNWKTNEGIHRRSLSNQAEFRSVNNPVSESSVPAGTAGFRDEDLAAVIPRLRRYALVLTGNPVRSDDLAQDTLRRAWEKRSQWRPGSDLRAWLFTIMHNLFVNQLAATRREAANASLDAEDEGGPPLHLTGDDDPTRRIELQEVMRQVQRLPAEQREVLMLVAVRGLRYEEISAELGIPIGTVMSRLSRARDKLKHMVAGQPLPLKAVGGRAA